MQWAMCLPPFLLSVLLLSSQPASAAPVPDQQGEWAKLTREAAEMGLPSRFLRLLPLEFVKLEFADLKNVAAEYFPESHRMVFHLSLSEGNEGKRFRPIKDIPSQDLATLYHELFHAYFDYVDFASGTPKMTPQGARLYSEARRLQACRYTVVELSPGPPQQGVLRKSRIEKRRLTDREGWDALNETWGVFVGWAIWNKLETTDRLNPAARWDWDALEGFLDRLDEAYRNGDLTGYFESANAEERRLSPRRYLAPSQGISAPEIALLLEVILDEPPGMARLAASWIAPADSRAGAPTPGSC